jgi:hypothetical protein
MRIEKLLRRYLCRELLQWTAADLCRAQKCSGAAVLLEIGQPIGQVSRTQGNAPHRNDLRYLPLNTRSRGPPRQRSGHRDAESGCAQRRLGVLPHPLGRGSGRPRHCDRLAFIAKEVARKSVWCLSEFVQIGLAGSIVIQRHSQTPKGKEGPAWARSGPSLRGLVADNAFPTQ